MTLQEATIKELINEANHDNENLNKYRNDYYYSFDNPELIDNLNSRLKNITAQELCDLISYFNGQILEPEDVKRIRDYSHSWTYIQFVPKRGIPRERVNPVVIDDNTINCVVQDTDYTTNIKVNSVYKTYKFIGSWY